MNSLAEQDTTRNMLDPEWIVAIQEEIDAQPENLADVIEPELLGRFDCEMGYVCNPTKYYGRLGDIEAYIIGWKEAEAILESLEREPAIEDDHDWIRGGC